MLHCSMINLAARWKDIVEQTKIIYAKVNYTKRTKVLQHFEKLKW